MANFVNHINLNKNQILNAALQHLAIAPENPEVGQVYFDTTDNKPKVWNGTTWDVMVSEAGHDYTPDIAAAKQAVLDELKPEIQQAANSGGSALNDAKAYTDQKIGELPPAPNVQTELAGVLRAQDPTINGLIKNISALTEDEKRQLLDPVRTELAEAVAQAKNDLTGGAADTLDTFKEVADKLQEYETAVQAVAALPKRFETVVGNGVATENRIEHNLGKKFVDVAIFDTNTSERVLADYVCIDANTVEIRTSALTPLNGHTVVVLG